MMSETELMLHYYAAKSRENRKESTMTEIEHKLVETKNKHWNECRQIALYDDENRKLKRLLMLAMEELTVPCSRCCTEYRERKRGCSYQCTWRHAAEARALLGE